MAATKRGGRPRKDLRALIADYHGGKAGRIYVEWRQFYDAWRPRIGEQRARGGAKRHTARRFKLSERRVEQIVAQGNALVRTLQTSGRANAAKQAAAQRAFRGMHPPIYKAIGLLGKPRYKDLLDGCAMIAHTKLPRALCEFSSAPMATAPDSVQYLAAMLARAFLRAHDIAEREIAGYTERKPPGRR